MWSRANLWSMSSSNPVKETTLAKHNFPVVDKGKVQKKKHKKKLTNVSLYVCMSAEKSKMLVFFYVFSPNSSLKDNFQNRGFMLDIHTYKLTFVSFFYVFLHLPLISFHKRKFHQSPPPKHTVHPRKIKRPHEEMSARNSYFFLFVITISLELNISPDN